MRLRLSDMQEIAALRGWLIRKDANGYTILDHATPPSVVIWCPNLTTVAERLRDVQR